MPLYYYRCEACGEAISKLFKARSQPETLPCDKGEGHQYVRSPAGPTARIVEVRDNGLMGRQVEQLADAERLWHERARIPESKFRKP